jgi:hypothetical protein
MRDLRWAVVALTAFIPCAYADKIPNFNITSATVSISPGSDNLSFILTGPGNSISGDGGINCQEVWCDGQVFAAGSTVPAEFGFDGQIFLENFTDAELGGNNYDPQTLGFAFWALDASGDVTLPSGGASSFTACGSASLSSPVSGLVGAGPTFTNFTLQMPAGGRFCSTWDFDSAAGGYTFASGRFTAASVPSAPEPATLGLLIAGLAGIAGARRARRNCGLP